MLLLSVDTSGKNGSLGLARISADRADLEMLEIVPLAGGTFSAQLVPQIMELLAKPGYTKADLGAFAVASGPGSFTGLRVGLAVIKAFGEVLEKPIAAVSLLEAIAWSAPVQGRILAALDAGRTDVYVGDYEPDAAQSRRLRMRGERLLTRAELLAEAGRKTVVTPDRALAEVIRASGITCHQIDFPDSAVIARLGWQHIRQGQTVKPEELEANYIRRTDAEIFSPPLR